jgi:hypothetical protein
MDAPVETMADHRVKFGIALAGTLAVVGGASACRGGSACPGDFFYCPDLGQAFQADSRDEAEAVCRERVGGPDAGLPCHCSCDY